MPFKFTILFIVSLLIINTAFPQVPQGINYQAVARDENGSVLSNTSLTVKLAILRDAPDGSTVWECDYLVTTNDFGLFSLIIGKAGCGSYNFTDIDWGNHTFFINVKVNDGDGFVDMGTTQLLSVPYALYAKEAGNVDDADADPTNELLHSAQLNSKTLELTDAGGTKQVDLSPIQDGSATDDQTLSISGHNLSIENGNTITLPDSVTDADADTTNEIQDLELTSNNLAITKNASATSIDLSSYLDNTDNQNLYLNNDTLTIENGYGSINLNNYINDDDADSTNELQLMSIQDDTIFLTDGGFVKLPASPSFSGSYDDLTDVPTYIDEDSTDDITVNDTVNWDKDVTDDFDGQYTSLSGTPDLSDTADYLTNEADPVYTNSLAYDITDSDTTNWNNKSDFSGDYNDLTNKPTLSEILAIGNSVGSYDLNINSKDLLNVDDIYLSSGSIVRFNNASELQFRNGNDENVGLIRGADGGNSELYTILPDGYQQVWLDASDNWLSIIKDNGTTGELMVSGDLTANGTKNFVEPYPGNINKEIYYSCLEGGEAATYFRGESKLINGQAIIDFPKHFKLVTSKKDLTAHLTPKENCNGLYIQEINSSRMIVKELKNGKSNVNFYYVVYGIRKGYEDYKVIRSKTK